MGTSELILNPFDEKHGWIRTLTRGEGHELELNKTYTVIVEVRAAQQVGPRFWQFDVTLRPKGPIEAAKPVPTHIGTLIAKGFFP